MAFGDAVGVVGMSNLDAINGVFEMVGSVVLYLNVVKVYQDKMVRGYDWRSVAFFAVWGAWSVAYYAGLGHTISLVGGALALVAQIVWIGFAIHYNQAPQGDQSDG